MPKKSKYARQAAAIRAAAERWVKLGQREFADDPDMVEAYESDAEQLNEIAGLLDRERLSKAQDKADDLDSSARDTIPEKIWYQLFANKDAP